MDKTFRDAGDLLAHVEDSIQAGEFQMDQWFDETLVAIKAFRGKYKVLELPARSSDIHSSHRYFSTPELAEAYIEREYDTKTITVQPEDITEEQARRFAVEMKATEQESEDDNYESSEDHLERQAQAHLEAAAQHRDDPMF